MSPRLGWALVAATALAYPVAVLGGGAPRFPDRTECVHAARTDGDLEAVFGRFRRQDAADSLLARALRLGFAGSKIEPDGCGYLKVVVHGVPSLAVGRALAAEAKTVGLRVTVEQATP